MEWTLISIGVFAVVLVGYIILRTRFTPGAKDSGDYYSDSQK